MGDKLGLVIPTLNEEANIAVVLDRIRTNLNDLPIGYEILVVDDDSTDGTGAIVCEYSKSDPRVRLLVRRGCRGLAGAVGREAASGFVRERHEGAAAAGS